ncbi:hypothetical protein [Streptomyces sp. TR02-1]
MPVSVGDALQAGGALDAQAHQYPAGDAVAVAVLLGPVRAQ